MIMLRRHLHSHKATTLAVPHKFAMNPEGRETDVSILVGDDKIKSRSSSRSTAISLQAKLASTLGTWHSVAVKDVGVIPYRVIQIRCTVSSKCGREQCNLQKP